MTGTGCCCCSRLVVWWKLQLHPALCMAGPLLQHCSLPPALVLSVPPLWHGCSIPRLRTGVGDPDVPLTESSQGLRHVGPPPFTRPPAQLPVSCIHLPPQAQPPTCTFAAGLALQGAPTSPVWCSRVWFTGAPLGMMGMQQETHTATCSCSSRRAICSSRCGACRSMPMWSMQAQPGGMLPGGRLHQQAESSNPPRAVLAQACWSCTGLQAWRCAHAHSHRRCCKPCSAGACMLGICCVDQRRVFTHVECLHVWGCPVQQSTAALP